MASRRALPTRAGAALALAAFALGCDASTPVADAAADAPDERDAPDDLAPTDVVPPPPDRAAPADGGAARDADVADAPADDGAPRFDGWLFDFPPARDAARDAPARDASPDAPVDAAALRDALAGGDELERLRLTVGVLRGAWCDQVFRCAASPNFSLPRASLADPATCRARLDALLDGAAGDPFPSSSPVSPWLLSLRVGGRPALADAVRAGRVRLDEGAALACLRALTTTCDAQLSWPPAGSAFAYSCDTLGPDDVGSRACQFVLAGDAAVGESCHVHEECRGDAWCDWTDGCPGRCAARSGAPGSNCDRQCPLRANPGLSCSCGEDAVAQCGEVRLTDPVGEGQACGDVVVGGRLYRTRCRDGLRCHFVCQRVHADGEACAAGLDGFCAEGFVCVDDRCVARVIRDAVGDPCDERREVCNPFLGLHCDADGCRRLEHAASAAPGGSPCTANAQCASNRCVDGRCDRPCDFW
ncbi:MAG: hypothetical protein U0324_16175 [Polyangiales bacterium]